MKITRDRYGFNYAYKEGESLFSFKDDCMLGNLKDITCRSCGSLLDLAYLYIIEQLKKANLIPRGYPVLCCECYSQGHYPLKRIGEVYEYY